MKAARTLQPEDQVAHYRIVSPLAAGGMGEVYLAQDQSLERSVALKILPPELVRSEERVRRFVREARSASSLNHPNIVTIYEIGQSEVRPGAAEDAAETESTSVHYISMELVRGETLTNKIHHEKTDLRILLGFLAQAAEGLAKAHAAGIVHRDLKPSNIMVSKDGFAKVLDFGLAKLTERKSSDPDATTGASDSGDATRAGMVMGTVGYMSPEQVQGKAVDHRSDIFSFGSILYEAATRRKPFEADSDVETMHKILSEKPAAVEELNPEAPAELRRLIRRCLAKNPDQRLQSAKDLALELREIADEYDSLSPSGTSGSVAPSSAAEVLKAEAKRRPLILAIVGAAVVIGILGISFGLWGLRRGGDSGPGDSFSRMRMTTLTNRGDVQGAVISPDGRYAAYVSGPGGLRSIWVRQIATGTEVEILPAPATSADNPSRLTFSPDGNYLCFLRRDHEDPNYSALYQIPSLGGTPVKKAFDVDTPISFAPDGKRACFARGMPDRSADGIFILDLETGGLRELTALKWPMRLAIPTGDLAWSPDGRRIAAVLLDPVGSRFFHLVAFDAENGRREDIPVEALTVINGIAWLPDGTGLVVAGLDLSGAPTQQIGIRSYPKNEWRRVTNDLFSYSDVSVTGSGDAIAAMRTSRLTNVWSLDLGGDREVRALTSASSAENSIAGMRPVEDGSILYVASRDQRPRLWEMRPDGTAPRLLGSGQSMVFSFLVRPTGIFYSGFGEDRLVHVWRMDRDGGNEARLTAFAGEFLQDVSPDGNLVLFTRFDRPSDIWAIPSGGGDARPFVRTASQEIEYAPDGSKIRMADLEQVGERFRTVTKIASVGAPGDTVTLAIPPGAFDEEWTMDSGALTYCLERDGVVNVYRSRVDGSPAEQLTSLSGDRISGHEWSPDGSSLLLIRQAGMTSNAWLADARGRNPEQLTDFKTGQTFDARWTPDGKRLLILHGDITTDVVLIRNFQ